MLKENTGTNFLDSGGAYGRNWERNQTRRFDKEPACEVEVSDNGVMIGYNIYHYLNNFLEYTPECKRLEAQFNALADLPENKGESWLAIMETFAAQFTSYGTTNSYNYDNILSQVIQYTMFSLTDDEYDVFVLLQIHGGCDVRGGYTKPRIFKVLDRDYFLMAQSDVNAYCPKCKANWMSDDSGYNWYYDGSTAKEPADKQWDKVILKDGKALCPCGGIIEFRVNEDF